MLTNPDLNRLKFFHAIYESGSLIRAGQRLHVTRSAVSQNLKALELELGTKLFLRDNKKVVPTDSAAKLMLLVGPFLTNLESSLQQLHHERASTSGHLRIGAPQDFGSFHLTDAIVAFRRKFPLVTFELKLSIPPTLLEMVAAGQLDLAFVDNGDWHAQHYPVSMLPVQKETFVLVGSKKYCERLFPNLAPKLADLKKAEFVDYLRHAPLTKLWMKHKFRRSPIGIESTFCAENVRAVLQAVRGGLGLGVVPERLVAADLAAGRLLEIHSAGPRLVNQIALVRRLTRVPTRRETAFVEFYKEYARKNRP